MKDPGKKRAALSTTAVRPLSNDGSEKLQGEWSSSIHSSEKSPSVRWQREFAVKGSNVLVNGWERLEKIRQSRYEILATPVRNSSGISIVCTSSMSSMA